MLIDIFIKSSEQRVLSLFAVNPDQAFYGRQISRKLKISLGAAHKALSLLEKNGILVSQNIGKTKLYRLKDFNPIINAFKILNTLIILDPLTQALKESSRRVILFGSYATGTFTSESDLDLFVVSEEKEKVENDINNLKRKTNLDIRPVIMRLVEWIKLENEDPEFFNEVNCGITLWEKPTDERGF
jgi:predicted nucleotidyltransferase/biotin operon repressor